MSTQARLDAAVEVAKATPAASIVGFTILGYPLSEVTALLAFILICLQLIFLIRDKVWNRKRKDSDDD